MGGGHAGMADLGVACCNNGRACVADDEDALLPTAMDAAAGERAPPRNRRRAASFSWVAYSLLGPS